MFTLRWALYITLPASKADLVEPKRSGGETCQTSFLFQLPLAPSLPKRGRQPESGWRGGEFGFAIDFSIHQPFKRRLPMIIPIAIAALKGCKEKAFMSGNVVKKFGKIPLLR